MGSKRNSSQNTTQRPKPDSEQGIIDKLLNKKCSRVALVVASISVIGTIIVAFISQGIFTPAINNFLYPKHSVIQTSFVLPPNQIYPYCVIFQQSDEYSIKISTDGTPVNLHILPESAYKTLYENGTLMTKESEIRIINGNYPYLPSQPGQYRILVDNRVGSELPAYANKSVIVNLTIEANRICAT